MHCLLQVLHVPVEVPVHDPEHVPEQPLEQPPVHPEEQDPVQLVQAPEQPLEHSPVHEPLQPYPQDDVHSSVHPETQVELQLLQLESFEQDVKNGIWAKKAMPRIGRVFFVVCLKNSRRDCKLFLFINYFVFD